MNNRRSILNFLAVMAMFASTVFPSSAIASAFKWIGMSYLAIDVILRARDGYRRRRPHWTRESWRGYVKLCLIPAVALLIMVGMMTALELRMPGVGAARSTLRMFWALGTVLFMVVFVIGLITVIERLHEGDASRPFEWPRWLRRRQSTP